MFCNKREKEAGAQDLGQFFRSVRVWRVTHAHTVVVEHSQVTTAVQAVRSGCTCYTRPPPSSNVGIQYVLEECCSSLLCHYTRVCVCAHVHMPPTLSQFGLGFPRANTHYTKTRGDTSSAAHTLTSKKLHPAFAVVPHPLCSKQHIKSLHAEREGQANTTQHRGCFFTLLSFCTIFVGFK